MRLRIPGGRIVMRPYKLSPTSLALGHLSRRERLTGVFVRLCVSHDLNPTP